MRGTAVWFALNARLAKLRPYSIALVFSQAQRKIAETSASGVQDKLADGAAILRERRKRLEAKRHEQLGEARAHVLEGELRVKRQRQLLEELLARAQHRACAIFARHHDDDSGVDAKAFEPLGAGLAF